MAVQDPDPIFTIAEILSAFELYNSSVDPQLKIELGPNLQTPDYAVLVERWSTTLGPWQVL